MKWRFKAKRHPISSSTPYRNWRQDYAAALSRYKSLPRDSKLLFWQRVSHEITIVVRAALYSEVERKSEDTAIKEGVQILHIAAGHCMPLLSGKSEERPGLIEAVKDFGLLQDGSVDRALEQAEQLNVAQSPHDLAAAAK